MSRTKTWAICVAIWLLLAATLSLPAPFAGAAQVLRATPNKVDMGTFNTFQVKETTVKLKNTAKKTFHIDKIKADCACIRTMIETEDIPSGKTVELKIAARERTGGKFSHDLLIIPKDTKRYEPLRIQATGNVIQPVFAKVGWEGKKLETFDPNGPMNLGLMHKLSVKPVICITADDNHFYLRDAVPDVNSTLFELSEHRLEKLPTSDDKRVRQARKERLVLSLKPKTTPKTGALRNLLRIKLAEDVRLEIPISCRVVGDAYGADEIIHLGRLPNSAPKKFTIHFANNAKVWPDLKWDIKGYLSSAIAIRREEIVRTDSQIGVTLAVDPSRLASLPQGYLYCRIKFYQDRSTDDTVSLLVDGFNTRSND